MNKMGVAAFVVAGVVIAGLLTGASSFLLAGSGEDAGPGQDVSLTELRGTGPLDRGRFRDILFQLLDSDLRGRPFP